MKNLNILLINPPTSVDKGPRVIYFGIAYIYQEIKRNNFDVELLDIDGKWYSKQEVSDFIRLSNCNVIGIGGLATIYPYLDWLIPEIKRHKPNAEIILGGAIAASLSNECFERFEIDFEVIGEGEVTISELLKEIAGKRDFASVKGIGYRNRGEIIFNKRRELMQSLEDIPMIDYTPFPLQRYLKYTNGMLLVHVQRGCPGNCTFCFNCYRVIGKAVRYRPVNHVLDEIQLFKEKYGVNRFNLSGECIMFHKSWIIDFAKETIRRGLKIEYKVNSRVDNIDEERLEWIRKSGCTILSLGVESGSQKILNIMKKGVTVEQNRRAVLLAKRYIPKVEYSIMFGYIGEDEDTIKDSVKFVKDMGIRIEIFYYATAFPGTEL